MEKFHQYRLWKGSVRVSEEEVKEVNNNLRKFIDREIDEENFDYLSWERFFIDYCGKKDINLKELVKNECIS